jgi:hypothetical protein
MKSKNKFKRNDKVNIYFSIPHTTEERLGQISTGVICGKLSNPIYYKDEDPSGKKQYYFVRSPFVNSNLFVFSSRYLKHIK